MFHTHTHSHTHAQHPRGVGSCLKLRITVFQRKEAAKCEQDMKPKTWIFRTLVSQSKKSAQKSAWRAFVQRSMARFLSVSKMQGDEQMQLTYLLVYGNAASSTVRNGEQRTKPSGGIKHHAHTQASRDMKEGHRNSWARWHARCSTCLNKQFLTHFPNAKAESFVRFVCQV